MTKGEVQGHIFGVFYTDSLSFEVIWERYEIPVREAWIVLPVAAGAVPIAAFAP